MRTMNREPKYTPSPWHLSPVDPTVIRERNRSNLYNVMIAETVGYKTDRFAKINSVIAKAERGYLDS